MAALLSGEGTVLHELRDRVLVVVDPVANALSSTAVRTQVAQVPGHILAWVPTRRAIRVFEVVVRAELEARMSALLVWLRL